MTEAVRHTTLVLVSASLGSGDEDLMTLEDEAVTHARVTGDLTMLVLGAMAATIYACPRHVDPEATRRVALFDIVADPQRIHPLIIAQGPAPNEAYVAYHDWGFADDFYKPEGYDEDRAVADEEARTENLLSHWADGTLPRRR